LKEEKENLLKSLEDGKNKGIQKLKIEIKQDLEFPKTIFFYLSVYRKYS